MIGAHYLSTNDCDFTADTVYKAIVKLHRLNRLQHTSSDDWAANLLEATKHLDGEANQMDFINYLSNPGNYPRRAELWDSLESWEKKHTDAKIISEVQHDPEEELYSREGCRRGSTVWIEQGPLTQEEEKEMPAIEEEKMPILE